MWNFVNDLKKGDEGDMAKKPVPYVTRKCPKEFIRMGCCKCMPKCSPKLFITTEKNHNDQFDYCIKKRTFETQLIKKSEIDEEDQQKYEFVRDEWWVKKCGMDFQRIGETMCTPKCPYGWPDLGDRCQKKNMLVLMPFVWQVGDGADF